MILALKLYKILLQGNQLLAVCTDGVDFDRSTQNIFPVELYVHIHTQNSNIRYFFIQFKQK